MPLAHDYINNRALVAPIGGRILPAAVIKETWTDPIAVDDNGISVSHAGAGAAGTTNQTIGGALASGGVATMDYARNVVITVTHGSAVVAMSGVITGTDRFGRTITEDWSVTAGGTSKVFTGKKGFKTVTGITEVVAADASANTIISGTGKVFGLLVPCSVASPVKEISGGSVVTNGVLVAASAVATDDTQGSYAPNTTPDGSVDYTIYYLSDTPETTP